MTSKRSLILIFLLFIPSTVFGVTRYVVKEGDSLYELSKIFNVSVNDLRKANELNGNKLDVGNVILIPNSTSSTKKAASLNSGEYIVGKGDTLSGIGKKFGVSADYIKNVNNLKKSNLHVGQRLLIPSSDSVRVNAEVKKETTATIVEKNYSETKSEASKVATKYKIKKGDTLGGIARKFGVSVNKLRTANGFPDDNLRIGKILIIPASTSSVSKEAVRETSPKPLLYDNKYIVRKGDNLYGISRKFGVSVDSIKNANGLSSSSLKVGDSILIPGSIDRATTVEPNKYVVAKNDTLSEISAKFGVSANSIKRVNNLKSNSLRIGQKLIIPSGSAKLAVEGFENIQKEQENSNKTRQEKQLAKSTDPRSVSSKYKVKKGDTLGKIANKFDVPLSKLKSANGFKSNKLMAGKVITIPGASNKGFVRDGSHKPIFLNRRYVVKKGDNLHVLSKKFDTSVSSIKRASGIKGSSIRIGQVLTIPAKEQYIDTSDENLSKSYSTINRNGYNGKGSELYGSRDNIINVAKRFLGAPYKFGGTSPVRGIDCSAFVNKVFDFFNVELPRTARDIYKVGQSVDKSELATGDLVFFQTYASYPSHVGIYINNDEFIHASSAAKKVTIDSMNRSYYRKRYIGAKRIEVSGLFFDEMAKSYKGFEKH